MQNIINRILANNLADFEGLKIEGNIAVSEALVNELIQQYLKPATDVPPVAETTSTATTIDFKNLLNVLNIEQAQVELQTGKMNVHLKITR